MHVATPGRPRALVPVVVPVPLAELGLTLLLVLSRPSYASHVVSRPFALLLLRLFCCRYCRH